jgi:hypothetical protein
MRYYSIKTRHKALTSSNPEVWHLDQHLGHDGSNFIDAVESAIEVGKLKIYTGYKCIITAKNERGVEFKMAISK